MTEWTDAIDWQQVAPWALPAVAFVAGWLVGRRGSTAAALRAATKAIHRVAVAVEQQTRS